MQLTDGESRSRTVPLPTTVRDRKQQKTVRILSHRNLPHQLDMLWMFGFLTDGLRKGTNILGPQICSLHATRLSGAGI